MAEWRKSKWGDEISLEYGKAIRGYQDAVAPYRVYGTNGPVGWTDKPLAPGPGVILGRKGAYRGVHYSRDPFFVIDTAYYVKKKSNDLDMRWLYYAIIDHKLGEIDDGSPIPSTTRAAVYVRDLSVPPLELQREVASILGALDDKIELNRRTNETLEALAQALFKHWFLDFGPTRAKMEGREPYLSPDLWALFPDRLNEETGLPERWQIATIEEVAVKVALGPFGSNIKVSTFVPDGVPIISGQHLNGTILEEPSFNYITLEHADRLVSSNVYRGDVVFTHAGNIGQVSYIPASSKFQRYVLSQRQFYLRCNLDLVSPIFMVYFFRSEPGQHKLLANTSSTGVPSIARPASNLKMIDFCLPEPSAIAAFDQLVAKLHENICRNRHESESLAQVRDALLPKLMSGEIRLRDAEKIAGEVL